MINMVKPRFKETFITVSRAYHLREKTIRAYWFHARHFIKWSGAKSIDDLANNATNRFRKYLSMMANDNHAASTQNQAFHALRHMYENVLDVRLGDLSHIPRATREERIVDVPSDDIAMKLVESVGGSTGLALRLIYGTGMRLSDCLRLRVKDLDFKRKTISIQESKGGKCRMVPMPENLIAELVRLVRERERTHEADIMMGYGWVHMPTRLAVNYPTEQTSFSWQYIFPAERISRDPITGKIGRHHLMDTTLQRAFAAARKKLRIKRRYTIHSLRHATAQFWERNNVPLSDIQTLLGHSDVKTTTRYTRSGRHGVPKVPCPI